MTRPDAPVMRSEEPHVIGRAGNSTPPAGGDNIVELLRELVGQGTHLAEQELRLVKAEVRESAAEVKTAVGGLLGAAVVGIAGLGVVLMGLAYLLAAQINNLGLATLLVGGASLVLAIILYRGAADKMSATRLTPDRTQRTLQRTPDALRGDL